MTLPTLQRILRSHYQEKNATDLYKQLTSEVQGIKETPQSFLIRAFDLRQKILFASQEAESGLKYDPGLVQNMFLHTVLTGLQSDNIKRDLQPYLEQTDISDELLLEHMNTACAYETERQNKRKLLGQQCPLTIYSVQSSDTPVKKYEKSSAQQNLSKISPMLLSQLEEMRSEMALLKDLKAEVSQIRESMQPPQCMPRQHPAAGGPDGTSAQQFPSQQVQDPPQGYWVTPGKPGETAQYQQKFAPQHSFPPPNRGHMRRCYSCQQRALLHTMLQVWQQRAFPGWLSGDRTETVWRASFKRGKGVTSYTASSQHCAHCGQKGEGIRLKQFASCKKVLYCSKPCQVHDWIVHQDKCAPPSCMTVNTASKRERA